MYEWSAKAQVVLFDVQDDLNLCILCMLESTFSNVHLQSLHVVVYSTIIAQNCTGWSSSSLSIYSVYAKPFLYNMAQKQ